MNEERQTLIVNLFGSPGTGKSTCAAYIFALLKMQGISCEYVSEFAKDKVWEQNMKIFENQFYITGKQSWKIARVFGQVDVIVNDSPILTGAVFTNKKYLKYAIVEEFMSYGNNNLNILLQRQHEYDPTGRNETEEEAKEVDKRLLDMFQLKDIESDYECIPYVNIPATQDGCNTIVELILNVLKYIDGDETKN